MIKYYTKAWQDECTRLVNSDAQFRQDAKKLNGIFVFRVYDCPDGKDRTMLWTFKQGELTECKYEAVTAPWDTLRQMPFDKAWVMRGTCPYKMMAALNKGEMSPLRALASPSYKLEGNKMLIMQLMKPLNRWNEICASVVANYEYTSEDDVVAAASSEASPAVSN